MALTAGCGEGDLDEGDADEAVQALSGEKATIPGPSRFDLYFTQLGGPSAIERDLLALIDGATQNIDVAAYSFNRQPIIDALLRARSRGVTVRLVSDGDNADLPGPVQLAKTGVPRVLRPAGDGIMHDKFLVVDRRFLFAGSANLTTAALELDNNNALILEDPALARAYGAEFEEMFSGRRFGAKKNDTSPTHETTINGVRVEFYFGPRQRLMDQVLAHLGAARRSARFLIFTFARQQLRERLVASRAAGLSVQGVFDRLQAQGNESEDEALANADVPTWIDGNDHAYGGGSMHHKVLILDGEAGADPTVITGSFNWTSAADSGHDENLLILHSAAAAQAYLQEYCSVVARAARHPFYKGSERGCEGRARLNEVLADPPGADAGQEYVELINGGLSALDLGGATLSVDGMDRHVFPPDFALPPVSVSVIYDRGASDALLRDTPGALRASLANLGLRASGGTVTLKDRGGAVLDSFAYGAAPEGTALNRSPDGDGAPVPHDQVPGAAGPRSPGRRADGGAYWAVGARSLPLPGDLLLTQVATRGPQSTSDDLVELYNPTGRPITLTGVKLQFRSTSCGAFYTRHVMPAGRTILPGRFYLVAASGYRAPASGPPADGALSGSLPDSGSLRLVGADGAVLDLLAYGAAGCGGEGGTTARGQSAALKGASIVRRPYDGAAAYAPNAPAQDRGDNAVDFGLRTARAPRNDGTQAQLSRPLE